MSSNTSMSGRDDLLLTRIGERVAERRKKRLLSQKELATSAGLSRASVSNIEGGRQHISMSTLLALSDALDCEPRDLLPFRRELTKGAPAIMRADNIPLSDKTEDAIAEFTSRKNRG